MPVADVDESGQGKAIHRSVQFTFPLSTKRERVHPLAHRVGTPAPSHKKTALFHCFATNQHFDQRIVSPLLPQMTSSPKSSWFQDNFWFEMWG